MDEYLIASRLSSSPRSWKLQFLLYVLGPRHGDARANSAEVTANSTVRRLEMKFTVHEVNQAASGGSYVCIFEAVADINSTGEISVSIEAVEPPNTDPELTELAAQGIRAGAAHVLEPIGRGAAIHVLRLVVNSTDFKVNRFTLYTAREFNRLLGKNA